MVYFFTSNSDGGFTNGSPSFLDVTPRILGVRDTKGNVELKGKSIFRR